MAVALSGGKDSSALLLILDYIRRHSHMKFELLGIHVRMGSYETAFLQELCKRLGADYRETSLSLPASMPSGVVCSVCARLKRGAMARVLEDEGVRKLALAHHADDMAQTILMNLAKGVGFLGFAPVVSLPGEPLQLIRPLIYLREYTLASLHRRSLIPLVGDSCPFSRETFRTKAKHALQSLELMLGREFPLRMVLAAEKARMEAFSSMAPPHEPG